MFALRPPWPVVGRWTIRVLVALACTLLIGAALGYLYLLSALPRVEGEVVVADLEAPVTIVRDRYGIPHIEAASLRDAIFAQGFVHAQDRLWQIEFQRRLGAGRLAELVGKPGIGMDRFMRTLGLYRRAQASLNHLAPQTRAWLEAYAAGVNAAIAGRRGALPPEFLILGHHVLEPWTPADSLVWLRMMALDLSTNWRDELLRLRLAQRLDLEQVADFWPDVPDSAPVTLSADATGLALEELADALPARPIAGAGSNAWIIGGERTRSGAPILANDPHLRLQAPALWYLAHLRTPELELIGATLPGVPGVVLGHNGTVAWGLTNTGADVQDLFVERLVPDDPDAYLTPDGTAPFAIREEEIRVKDAEPERLRVRETRHGPVLHDLVPPDARRAAGEGQVLALAWTALAEDDRTLDALFGLSQARDWESFRAALREVGAPVQNVHYADTAGHIGFIAPGRIPLRHNGDGRWPVPGWTGEHDWTGFIPFEELPQVLDPPAGLLFNANNRVVPDDYPHLVTHDWEHPYRARRLQALLAGDGHDVARSVVIQNDLLSLMATDLLPLMLEADFRSPEAATAAGRLAAWDRVARAEAAEPLIFAAWLRETTRLMLADQMGDLLPAMWSVRPRFIEHVLRTRQQWCDDQTTAAVESCAELLGEALDRALAWLNNAYGQDPARWRWGVAHPALLEHSIFNGVRLLASLFNIELGTGGDNTTVNVGHYNFRNPLPFASHHAASYRGIYDLANLDRSRFVITTGQSGHPLSPHYRDLAPAWAEGRLLPMERRPERYQQRALGTLRLQPSRADEGASN